MKHCIKAGFRVNTVLICLLLNMLSGCYAVESREEAVAKAKVMYKARPDDYALIARISDMFFERFPGKVLDVIHFTKSPKVIVRIKPENGLSRDIDVFDVTRLGISESELERVCGRNAISNIVCRRNRTIILSDHLDAHEFEIALIYSKDECCKEGDPDSEWCEQIGPNYYVKALLIRL